LAKRYDELPLLNKKKRSGVFPGRFANSEIVLAPPLSQKISMLLLAKLLKFIHFGDEDTSSFSDIKQTLYKIL